jgi:hypothetical protein
MRCRWWEDQSLINDYIPESRQNRLISFAEALAADLEAVKERIDKEKIHTDEYAYVFTKVVQDVLRDYQQAKLDAYRAILSNSLILDVGAAKREDYLYKVENMTAVHLMVLSWFRNDRVVRTALNHHRFEGGTSSLRQTLATLTDLDDTTIESTLHDLDTMGITNNMKGSLRTMMTPDGATQLEGRLTPYGREFLRFISPPG